MSSNHRAATDAIGIRLDALSHSSSSELRSEWRKLYGAEAPRYIGRDLLLLALAHRIQEQALGDLGKVVQRRLRTLSDPASPPSDASTQSPLSSGSRLVREWKGQTHTVIVLDQGYEYQGKRHRSLTEIAGLITGAHWSGPRFFGLKSSVARSSEQHHG